LIQVFSSAIHIVAVGKETSIESMEVTFCVVPG